MSNTNLDALITALKSELDGEISFSPAPPLTWQAPSVVVVPDPESFLEIHSAGASLEMSKVREQWEVLVVASMKDTAAGINQLRKNSLRVAKALSSVGGVWHGAVIRSVGDESNRSLVASVNSVSFVYKPNQELQ